jgi:small nuclear ribonucleoprotein (snRNP)-like protein
MYDIDSLIGKTVTLKTISGMEIISQLASFDE